MEAQLLQIIGELRAAIRQAVPSDDRIIMDHIRRAHEIAVQLRRGAVSP